MQVSENKFRENLLNLCIQAEVDILGPLMLLSKAIGTWAQPERVNPCSVVKGTVNRRGVQTV